MLTRSLRSAAGAAALASILSLIPGPASAAGFALFEQGARGMGFAGAFTAQASDPSAIFHNAAGIAFLRGKQVYFGGTAVAPSSTFTGADPFPGASIIEKGDAGVILPPSAYYTQPLTERVAVGIGFNVPFGLRSRWANPSTYSGRYISELAELKGFSINPTVSYKLADRLAVGAGLDIRLSSLKLERRLPLINPFTQKVVDAGAVSLESNTARGLGFNLGVLAKAADGLSVGASYRHRVKVNYKGSADFSPIPTGDPQLDARVTALLPQGAQPLTTAIVFPAFASVGAAYRIGDWTAEADVNWYQWNTFSRIILDFERNDLDDGIAEEYENSWQYRFGIERAIGETWVVRGGYFFDESPAPAASVSPLLPDANRHGIAIGGSWISGKLRLDAASWYVFSPSRSTEGVNRDDFNGTYKNRALTLGVSLGYVF